MSHRIKHGECRNGTTSKEYDTWKSIRQRCHNPKHFAYPKYGGAGILVSAAWRKSFDQFLADMGRAPSKKHTIERIDSSKGYSADNCRWATTTEQGYNKQSTRLVTFRGEQMCLGKAATLLGWEYTFAYYRARRHFWNMDKAAAEPIKKKKQNPGRVFPQKEYRSSEFATWRGIIDRCKNPRSPIYFRYGGAGIKICNRWSVYSAFLSDMGRRPSPNHTLDRIDSRGDYEPANCRWATMLEQGQNRGGAELLAFKGEMLSITQWAKRLGIKRRTLARRLERGWTPEKSLSIEVGDNPWVKRFEFRGELLTLPQWGARIGISYCTLFHRVSAGWSIEKTLTTPLATTAPRIRINLLKKIAA